ncbi:MAG: glycosyltransferase family 4 protein [Nanoarchaeota archaeon]
MQSEGKIRKHLIIATDCFIPRWDGVARFLMEIIPHLTEEYDVTVIAPDFPGDAADVPGIQIVRIPLYNWTVGDFQVPRIEMSVLKHYVPQADVLWVQTIGPIGGSAMRVAHKAGVPIIAYVHSIEWELVAKSMSRYNVLRRPSRFLVQQIARKLYNKCTHIMVPSEEVKELLVYNKIDPPSTIVHLGTDIDRFRPPEDKRQAKEALGIDPDTKVIGFVGRLAREKDLLTLYRSFIRLQKEHDDIRLLIVGGGVLEFEEHLKRRPGVIWVGPQNNVIPYYQAMDIYVLPSLLETTSLTTLEAMSCEIVPVCTPVGSVKHYIHEKKNGILFPKGNSLVLSLKLEWLLKHDILAREMAKQARITVRRNFSWSDTIAAIRNILMEM